MSCLRIAIVNDMVMVVELLKRIVSSVPGYQVAWVAYDGAECMRRCLVDPPDLVLMDLIMPVMGGVETTRLIMQQCPCAILVVTASVLGNISKVFEAMGYGALDVVRTPSLGNDATSEGTLELLHKIAMIARLIGKGRGEAAVEDSHKQLPSGCKVSTPPLVIMGASTGGPLALTQILSALPSHFPAPVVVIQHVDSHFIDGFVRWLGERCSLPVRVAQEGDVPTPGVIWVAGTRDHLILNEDLCMVYSSQPRDLVYVPSVDVFFNSVSAHWPTPGVGVILTGMGRDGANGLLALSKRGWTTIAQRKDSCVVYGMPKAAVDLHAAGSILPLRDIAPAIRAKIELHHGELHEFI